jgi:hypothetical protein
MDAKMCPDGSYVGRVAPDCAFAQCPNEAVTTSWKTFTNTKQGVSFKYPENPVTSELSTNTAVYISIVDWPPQIQIINERFACIEAGLETGRAGRTTRAIVNGHEYCVTTIQEGAAGSVYTQYAYAFPFTTSNSTSKTAIFTFTMRFPQCLNYNPPQRSQCQQAQASFDVNKVVDQMARTVHAL